MAHGCAMATTQLHQQVHEYISRPLRAGSHDNECTCAIKGSFTIITVCVPGREGGRKEWDRMCMCVCACVCMRESMNK